MFNRLVQFTLREEDNNYFDSKIIDIQYHLFTDCEEHLDFIYDPLYRLFTEKGYKWTAIDFEIDWANMIGFTMSKCNPILKNHILLKEG